MLGEKSPSIKITHNRRDMIRPGSLSPFLLKKLNAKYHFDDEDRQSSSRSRSRGRKRNKDSETLSNVQDNEIPAPSVGVETIRNLLLKEPVGKRLASFKKHELEFTSYLRPVLQSEIFDQDGDGWNFLATHVQDNPTIFQNVLKER